MCPQNWNSQLRTAKYIVGFRPSSPPRYIRNGLLSPKRGHQKFMHFHSPFQGLGGIWRTGMETSLSLSLGFCILNPFRQRAGGGGGGNFSIAARSLLSGRLQTPEPNALLPDILMHQEKFSKVKIRLDLEKKEKHIPRRHPF